MEIWIMRMVGSVLVAGIPNNDREVLHLQLLKGGLLANQGLGLPLVDEFLNLSLAEFDIVGIISGVGGRQEVADEEDQEEQFKDGADRIVLVAGLNVADKHGRAGHLLEGLRRLAQNDGQLALELMKIHDALLAGEETMEEWS